MSAGTVSPQSGAKLLGKLQEPTVIAQKSTFLQGRKEKSPVFLL